MDSIPGLGLRVGKQQERLGIDDAELGEFAVSLLHKTDNNLLEQESNSGFLV